MHGRRATPGGSADQDRGPRTEDRGPTDRPTTDDRRPTTDDRRPTTDDRRPTAEGAIREPAVENRQQQSAVGVDLILRGPSRMHLWGSPRRH